MASKEFINVLKFFINFSHSKLRLIPIHFQSKRNNEKLVAYTKLPKSSKFFWYSILSISLFVSVSELCDNIKSSETSFVKIVYHAFLLFSKWVGYTVILLFNINAHEICQFFNCFYNTKPSNNLSTNHGLIPKRNIKYNKDKIFYILTLGCAITECSFYSIFVPTVVLALPWLHCNRYGQMFGAFECSSHYFRPYIFAIQIVFLVPIAPIISTCCLVTLKEINTRLQNLW